MGHRAHVIKPGSTDEYTDADFFNRRIYEILTLFHNHNVKFEIKYFKYNRDVWTIKDTELNKLIATLEESPDEIDECFFEDMDLAHTNRELAGTFRYWVNHADKETGLIRIEWS